MTFDPSKYAVKNQGSNVPEYEPDPDFDPSRFAVQPDASATSEILRHAARTGSRIGESALGFIGDLNSLYKSGKQKLQEKAGVSVEPNLAIKAFDYLMDQLPTSESLRQKSIQATGGYTAPKNAAEELGDDVTSLATALALPAKNPLKFMNLLKSVGLAVGTKGAGEVSKVLGASPEVQFGTEMGTLALGTLLGSKTANQFVNGLYREARDSIPKGAMVNTGGLTQELSNVKTNLAKGVSTASKNEVMKVIDELGAKASGGAMEAEELVEAFHNINERMSSKKLFDELSKSEQRQLRQRYDLVKDSVRSTLKDYGNTNPEFYKTWEQANQGYATIQNSMRASRWIEKKIGSLPKHLALGLGAELLLGFPKTAAATVGSAGALKTGELLYRTMKSPALRKHYVKAISVASAQDAVAFQKELEALNKGLKE